MLWLTQVQPLKTRLTEAAQGSHIVQVMAKSLEAVKDEVQSLQQKMGEAAPAKHAAIPAGLGFGKMDT